MKLKGVESLYVEKGVEKVLLSVCVTSVEYIQMTSTRDLILIAGAFEH